VLRRTEALPSNLEPVSAGKAKFAGWTLDLQKRHLMDAEGRVFALSGAEFRLLRVFVTHPNRVLTRESIVESRGVANGHLS
jgi:two-component system OmpR family response regulator